MSRSKKPARQRIRIHFEDHVRVDKAPLVTRDQVTASNLKYRITRIERVKPAARRAA